MKTLMRWLGWAPLKELAEVQSEMADHVFSMRRWADKHEARSEHEFRKLAEQLAETREALHDRKQLHYLQRLIIDREAMMPPRPVFLQNAHNARPAGTEPQPLTTDGAEPPAKDAK
jgi:hypothetical protein